jgi:molybdopterin synthase catalytic subunit/molybdopterin converting factor small subunit
VQIRVLFFGVLKEIVGRADEAATLNEGATVRELFELYQERFPILTHHCASMLFSRNREFAGPDDVLRDGDEVAFLPPVSGGADETKLPRSESTVVCRLTREPIDTRAVQDELQRGFDGAVVVFEGIVRDHSGGRQTLYLEYEAYEPMAVAKMREIAHDIRENFAVDSIALIHRLGRLEIGEASVVIVVTSEHRGPAFEACRSAIDRLKRMVPIWKKEFFADGAVWVEGEQRREAMPQPSMSP